jgi:hypothetical protein
MMTPLLMKIPSEDSRARKVAKRMMTPLLMKIRLLTTTHLQIKSRPKKVGEIAPRPRMIPLGMTRSLITNPKRRGVGTTPLLMMILLHLKKA